MNNILSMSNGKNKLSAKWFFLILAILFFLLAIVCLLKSMRLSQDKRDVDLYFIVMEIVSLPANKNYSIG